MRGIKFRAWDTDTKQWVFEYKNTTMPIGLMTEYADRKHWVLSQYTGLKDGTPWEEATPEQRRDYTKETWNGAEIYEGDIVTDTRDKTTQEVRWYRGGFMLQTKGHFGFHDIERHDGDCKLFEVIGDIYSNPELVK